VQDRGSKWRAGEEQRVKRDQREEGGDEGLRQRVTYPRQDSRVKVPMQFTGYRIKVNQSRGSKASERQRLVQVFLLLPAQTTALPAPSQQERSSPQSSLQGTVLGLCRCLSPLITPVILAGRLWVSLGIIPPRLFQVLRLPPTRSDVPTRDGHMFLVNLLGYHLEFRP